MGDGSRIRFWHDLQCGDCFFKEFFPYVYSVAHVKDASMADNLEILGNTIKWNLGFIRAVQDWEIDLLNEFLYLLYSE